MVPDGEISPKDIIFFPLAVGGDRWQAHAVVLLSEPSRICGPGPKRRRAVEDPTSRLPIRAPPMGSAMTPFRLWLVDEHQLAGLPPHLVSTFPNH